MLDSAHDKPSNKKAQTCGQLNNVSGTGATDEDRLIVQQRVMPNYNAVTHSKLISNSLSAGGTRPMATKAHTL